MSYTSPTIPASGITFAQAQAAGASGHLERLIALMLAGTAAPGAAPTLSAAGGGATGGALAAGTYYVKVTETNGVGETTAGPEASVTIAAGNIPQATFAALQAGNVARNVYVGTASGAEVCYARGITAGTYNLSSAIPVNSYAVPVPTANSTGLTSSVAGSRNYKMEALRAVHNGRLQDVWRAFAKLYGDFSAGRPIGHADAIHDVRRAHAAFAALATVAAEFGALLEANPGTLTSTTNGIGVRQPVRQWP